MFKKYICIRVFFPGNVKIQQFNIQMNDKERDIGNINFVVFYSTFNMGERKQVNLVRNGKSKIYNN